MPVETYSSSVLVIVSEVKLRRIFWRIFHVPIFAGRSKECVRVRSHWFVLETEWYPGPMEF